MEIRKLQRKTKVSKTHVPDGIVYNRKNDVVRTQKVNSVFELTRSLSISFSKNKSGQKNKSVNLSASVTPNLQSSNFLVEDLREIGLFVKEHFSLFSTSHL